MLGVCRGCQVLNVALGGTLHGDLEEFPADGADHPGAKWDEWRALVAATLGGDRASPASRPIPSTMKPGSLLASHLGESCEVDSYHHQAVKTGTGLEAVAWAPHGTIEAVEMPGSPSFVLGVQWELHEEWQDDERMLGIWRTFVADAHRRMAEREEVEVP